MNSTTVPTQVSCAVEVFLATALLHKEYPRRSEFTIQEITGRAARENLHGELRRGISVHASQHCVANRPPNPAKHRMLFATGKRTRRLLLRGDETHPERSGKVFPDTGEIPEKYLALLEWAKTRYEKGIPISSTQTGRPAHASAIPEGTPRDIPRGRLQELLDLRLAGLHLANGEDPDDYVRRLREGWD